MLTVHRTLWDSHTAWSSGATDVAIPVLSLMVWLNRTSWPWTLIFVAFPFSCICYYIFSALGCCFLPSPLWLQIDLPGFTKQAVISTLCSFDLWITLFFICTIPTTLSTSSVADIYVSILFCIFSFFLYIQFYLESDRCKSSLVGWMDEVSDLSGGTVLIFPIIL